MATTDYTTLALVKDALGKTTVDGRDDLITTAITAASRTIDERCGRRFYLDDAASSRTYIPGGRFYFDRASGRSVLLVDDIATLVGLVVETGSATTAWTVVAGVETGTDNALVIGRSITQIRFPYNWAPILWPWESFRVTAKWGWPTVPAGVAQAATLLASRLYRRKDSPQGILASPDWGGLHVSRVDPDVEALIAPYTRAGFA